MSTIQIMGIVNVTPDSFSDGGRYADTNAAIVHARQLMGEGADILDIGGESTRPGAAPVSVDEEIGRVVPVVEALRDEKITISVDTRHAAVMRAAIAAGAGMINDITALTGDSGALAAVAEAPHVKICLMHMQGTPETMQVAPHYDDVVQEVYDYLAERIGICGGAGISRDRLYVDVGIGFGKTLAHNLALLKNLKKFQDLGVPHLLGVSRKSFIEKIAGPAAPTERLPGSLAAALWGVSQGVQILRVHDVAATRQALAVFSALAG